MNNNQVNWNQIEKEAPAIFNDFKSFLHTKNIPIEQVNKEILNSFITEKKFPVFINVPEKYEMSHENVKWTFSGMRTFLTLKK
jgi:hypothetical protein